MAIWTIIANFDPEARVWYTLEGDVSGLLADADTIEGLAEKAGRMSPDLLAIHADAFVDPEQLLGPHKIHVIAFHERDFDVAA